MRPDPDPSNWQARLHEAYDELNNDPTTLVGLFTVGGHRDLERSFARDARFDSVLEIGAGIGTHLRYVRHRFNHYVMIDFDPGYLEHALAQLPQALSGRVTAAAGDAARLAFPDGMFDRVISTNVLEHLVRPDQVLREWARVVKPGGMLSIALPCDPGLLWRLGRSLVARRRARTAGVLDYDYWQAREHINPIGNLVTFIRYYFPQVKESWYPARIPSVDLNLFYQANIRLPG